MNVSRSFVYARAVTFYGEDELDEPLYLERRGIRSGEQTIHKEYHLAPGNPNFLNLGRPYYGTDSAELVRFLTAGDGGRFQLLASEGS